MAELHGARHLNFLKLKLVYIGVVGIALGHRYIQHRPNFIRLYYG